MSGPDRIIHSVLAAAGGAEFGISRGRLLADRGIVTEAEVPRQAREKRHRRLVLVHGGMAQDAGPTLDTVTGKCLPRSETEWLSPPQANGLLEEIAGNQPGVTFKRLAAVCSGTSTARCRPSFHGPPSFR